MKKFLVRAIVVLLVLAAGIFIFQKQIFVAMEGLITEGMFVEVDADTFDPGIAVGEQFPSIRAWHLGEELNSVDAFMGERGLVFFAVRSVDWCPYCRNQLFELQQHVDAFAAAGIGVVAITYDRPELQEPFLERGAITYPFLADIDATTVQALGILNEEHAPGDLAYGVPHPGVYVLNPEQVIVGKLFVESYQQRVDAQSVLGYAQGVLGDEN